MDIKLDSIKRCIESAQAVGLPPETIHTMKQDIITGVLYTILANTPDIDDDELNETMTEFNEAIQYLNGVDDAPQYKVFASLDGDWYMLYKQERPECEPVKLAEGHTWEKILEAYITDLGLSIPTRIHKDMDDAGTYTATKEDFNS